MSTRLEQRMKNAIHPTIDGGKEFRFGKPRLCTVKVRNSLFRSKFGIGVAPANVRDGKMHRISYVQSKGPGSHAGIRLNDVILKVNDTPAEEFGHDDLVNFLRNYEKNVLNMTVVQPIQGDQELVA